MPAGYRRRQAAASGTEAEYSGKANDRVAPAKRSLRLFDTSRSDSVASPWIVQTSGSSMQYIRRALGVWRQFDDVRRAARILAALATVTFGLLVNGPGQAAPDGNTPQRAVLYDEDPSEPKGKMYYGSVVWRTIPDAAGQPDDFLAIADVDIPLRKLKMTLSFRRNNDKSLPASHVAELKFVLPPDFGGGGVGHLPGMLMKVNEQSRGSPLAALSVKVTDGFFMVGLSNVETERARNLELLERAWFDIPMVYFGGRRAILAL